jgi:hypothetical protein
MGPPPPGMPGGAGPPSRQAMTSGRIDPTQIPRVVQPNQETQVRGGRRLEPAHLPATGQWMSFWFAVGLGRRSVQQCPA